MIYEIIKIRIIIFKQRYKTHSHIHTHRLSQRQTDINGCNQFQIDCLTQTAASTADGTNCRQYFKVLLLLFWLYRHDHIVCYVGFATSEILSNREAVVKVKMLSVSLVFCNNYPLNKQCAIIIILLLVITRVYFALYFASVEFILFFTEFGRSVKLHLYLRFQWRQRTSLHSHNLNMCMCVYVCVLKTLHFGLCLL